VVDVGRGNTRGGSIIILHMEEYLMKCAYCDNWEKDTAENSED
jgi:hypothetical protein